MNSKSKTICYFGIYRPTAPRDKVYLDGLKKRGVQIVECVDNSRGLLKFFRLAKKLRALKNHYDILWAGYLSTMVVPLAWLITPKKIIFNTLDSWYDRSVIDRGAHSRFSPKAWAIWFCDFLAFHLSNVVLVESEQQKLFIAKKFFVRGAKLQMVFTGVDEEVFHPDPTISKTEKFTQHLERPALRAGSGSFLPQGLMPRGQGAGFTVIFRGMFLPATGVEHVIEAARLLKNEDIQFRIIGWGEPLQTKFHKMISDNGLSKVNLTTVFLPPDELRQTILSAQVMLGQFGDHERLLRTIQHKTSEAMALGMPYITRSSASNRELLTDGVNCLLVPPADSKAIAEKILLVMKNPDLGQSLAREARKLFEERLTASALCDEVLSIIERFA